MSNEDINISFTFEFKRNVRALSKRYQNIQKDIQQLTQEIQSGKLPGDQIPGIGLKLFKVRVKNSDIQKGKRGGYRCIYYLQDKNDITLVTIYSKSDQGDISAKKIQDILKEMGH
ncbi:MAG: type II toxin-antitoxin system RelE/ParE family toxin [Desulfovermiculus sp.]|nr:type II toxin-antitoxin system RelE/ParE family toxin [Desulfovermiculus sp.]